MPAHLLPYLTGAHAADMCSHLPPCGSCAHGQQTSVHSPGSAPSLLYTNFVMHLLQADDDVATNHQLYKSHRCDYIRHMKSPTPFVAGAAGAGASWARALTFLTTCCCWTAARTTGCCLSAVLWCITAAQAPLLQVVPQLLCSIPILPCSPL